MKALDLLTCKLYHICLKISVSLWIKRNSRLYITPVLLNRCENGYYYCGADSIL